MCSSWISQDNYLFKSASQLTYQLYGTGQSNETITGFKSVNGCPWLQASSLATASMQLFLDRRESVLIPSPLWNTSVGRNPNSLSGRFVISHTFYRMIPSEYREFNFRSGSLTPDNVQVSHSRRFSKKGQVSRQIPPAPHDRAEGSADFLVHTVLMSILSCSLEACPRVLASIRDLGYNVGIVRMLRNIVLHHYRGLEVC